MTRMQEGEGGGEGHSDFLQLFAVALSSVGVCSSLGVYCLGEKFHHIFTQHGGQHATRVLLLLLLLLLLPPPPPPPPARRC